MSSNQAEQAECHLSTPQNTHICTWTQVDVERALPQFKQDACIGQLDDLLRFCMRLHAEMAHITTNLQYYINLEVVECKTAAGACDVMPLLLCSSDSVGAQSVYASRMCRIANRTVTQRNGRQHWLKLSQSTSSTVVGLRLLDRQCWFAQPGHGSMQFPLMQPRRCLVGVHGSCSSRTRP